MCAPAVSARRGSLSAGVGGRPFSAALRIRSGPGALRIGAGCVCCVRGSLSDRCAPRTGANASVRPVFVGFPSVVLLRADKRSGCCCVGCSGPGFVRSASAQPVRSARVLGGPTGGLRPKLLRRMLGSRVRPARIRTARPFRPRVERSGGRFAAGPVAARISRRPLRRNPQAVFRARRGRFPRCVRRGGYGPCRLGTV